jgi:hypothetical protein
MDNSFDELFDDNIRRGLENLKETGAPQGWEALEGKMAADADLSADPFDEMIKSKLEGGNAAAYDPGFWSLMESRIEADADLSPTEIEDLELDGLVYENLNSFQVPYNSNHWELMLRRINKEFSIQHHLYKYKVAEVSLMLLLILTLLQFYPGNNSSSNLGEQNIEANQTTNQSAATESIVSEEEMTLGGTEVEVTIEKENISNATLIAAAKKDKLESQSQKGSNHSSNNSFNSAYNNTDTSLAKANEGVIASAEINSIDNLLPPLPLQKEQHGDTSISDTQLAAIVAADKEATAQRKAEMEQEALLLDETIFDLLTLEKKEMDVFKNDDPIIPDCKSCTFKRPWAFKLGMLASIDFNLVMTPFDAYFSSDSYDQLTSGYTGGLSFSVHRNRLGFATGATYSSKSYEPRKNKEVVGSLAGGYVEEGLQGAQLNILSIPANFTYNFDNKGKWQWYALLGVSAKLATINNFDLKSEPASGSRARPDPRIIAAMSIPEEVVEDPYSGAFEGGSFKKNFFLTANLGFGMERYVTSRWSVFLQPTYQHSLYKRALGPNNDRIHSLSLFLGTRATLK